MIEGPWLVRAGRMLREARRAGKPLILRVGHLFWHYVETSDGWRIFRSHRPEPEAHGVGRRAQSVDNALEHLAYVLRNQEAPRG